MYCYSVFDRKANCYNTPFFCHTDGVAVRNFQDLVLDSRSSVNRHPDDYSLYKVGEFTEASGLLIPLSTPAHISNATEFAANISSSCDVSSLTPSEA